MGGKRPRHGGSAIAAIIWTFIAAWTARWGEAPVMTAALLRRSYGLSLRLRRRDEGNTCRDGCVIAATGMPFDAALDGAIGGELAMTAALSRRSYGLSVRLGRRDWGNTCHDGCVIAAIIWTFIAASAARWGGSARVMAAALSRRPLCLSTRLGRRDWGNTCYDGCAVAAIIRASLRRFGLTDVEFLLGGREVVPEHVPAADADLQIAVLFGVRLSVAQRVGREDVEVYGVAAAVGVGH